MTNKKSNKWDFLNTHGSFLGLLVLLVGFSSYAIFSFFVSTQNYIDEYYASAVRATPVIFADAPILAQSKENPFIDLSDDHSNADAVIALYYQGVVAGYSDSTFKPDKKVNRAEFAKMLVEASDLDYTDFEASVMANCFRDVKDLPDHWFAPSVCAAKTQGWISGYDGGNFLPTQNINRAEALKIVLSAFGFAVPDNSSVTEKPYSDVALDSWYLTVATAAKEQGIISSSGNFNAGLELSRAEIAQMIYNAMGKKGLLGE